MKAILIFLLLALLQGCAVNPVTGREDFVLMSESDEIAMGRQSDLEVRKQYGVYESKHLQEYVNRVGQRLAANSHRPNLTYHFTVLDSPEVNAFALPGGYVYITRGILPYLGSEADLAAVLGHEIGHVTARHSVKQYTAATATQIGAELASIFVPEMNTQAGYSLINVSGNALLSGYGREHELEADKLGSEYLARTGYDPHAMIEVLSVLKNQEEFDKVLAREEHRQPRAYHGLFASHPDTDTRLQQVVNAASSLEASPHPVVGRRIYLQEIDGLTFGDSPAQGVVRNNEFLHAGLGIALNFPPDWVVKNTPKKLQAISPGADAAIELTLVEKYAGDPALYLLKRFSTQEATRIGASGLQGAMTQISPKAEAAAFVKDGNLFAITAVANSAQAFSGQRAEMEKAIYSFHSLSSAEKKLAQGLRISIRHAGPRDTFESLSKGSPFGKNATGYLRLLNEAYPNGEPRPGEEIKLVE
ncbi:MAG: M48 family metalloprotease [Burkholderiales bacterium]|nr:M48 family metalloprotease [Burkholderiales bacterium]